VIVIYHDLDWRAKCFQNSGGPPRPARQLLHRSGGDGPAVAGRTSHRSSLTFS